MQAPLAGLTVIAVEQAVAAPYCTARMADAGARVIKIERAEGDFARYYDAAAPGSSSYFVWLNRGKESVVLDLARAEGRAQLAELIAQADILVQNLKPGAMARMGLGAEALRKRHPRLICCGISGYGETGPLAARKAYDLLIQAESGLASITGGPAEPARVGISVADIATGATAYEAVLEALIARGRTGEGADIQVSMFDVMADWLTVPLLNAEAGKAPQRIGLAHPSIAPYGVFTGSDGKQLLISIQSEREWVSFCRDVLQRPEAASLPQFSSNIERVKNRPETDALVAGIFARLPSDALAARLDQADIAFASLNDMAALSKHPHLRRIEVGTASGPAVFPAPGARMRGVQRSYGAVPALGAQTDAVLTEFFRRQSGLRMSEPVLDLVDLQRWIGRTETARDEVSERLRDQLNATLDREPEPGADLPLTAHWCLAPPCAPTAQLGPDGHPARGGFLPPVPLPRRMWAGGALQLHDRLQVGDAIERHSQITAVDVKHGRTGVLCFVTVAHEIFSPRGLAISERQDIVFRAMEATAPALPPKQPLPKPVWERAMQADTVLLFRYSALTFNGHRIHYDRRYAVDVELYPGLVVHGPLQASLLVEFAADIKASAPKKFSFRGVSPLFDGVAFRLCAEPVEAGLHLWVQTEHGVASMEAQAEW